MGTPESGRRASTPHPFPRQVRPGVLDPPFGPDSSNVVPPISIPRHRTALNHQARKPLQPWHGRGSSIRSSPACRAFCSIYSGPINLFCSAIWPRRRLVLPWWSATTTRRRRRRRHLTLHVPIFKTLAALVTPLLEASTHDDEFLTMDQTELALHDEARQRIFISTELGLLSPREAS